MLICLWKQSKLVMCLYALMCKDGHLQIVLAVMTSMEQTKYGPNQRKLSAESQNLILYNPALLNENINRSLAFVDLIVMNKH